MKKMSLLITILFATASCVATDLSDLDTLYINFKDGSSIAPVSNTESVAQTTDNSLQEQTDNADNSLQEQNKNDDSESAVQQQECEYIFCNDLETFSYFFQEGDKVGFGQERATIEGFYDLNDDVWRQWYNEQYGIEQSVRLVRYIYDVPINQKNVVIETFYNKEQGEFLFSRVLYQGDYENMMNFLVVIDYEDRRPDFDPEVHFKDNAVSKYYSNADGVYNAVLNYLREL